MSWLVPNSRFSFAARDICAQCQGLSPAAVHGLATRSGYDAPLLWGRRDGLWGGANGRSGKHRRYSQHGTHGPPLFRSLRQLGPRWGPQGGFPCHSSWACPYLPLRHSSSGQLARPSPLDLCAWGHYWYGLLLGHWSQIWVLDFIKPNFSDVNCIFSTRLSLKFTCSAFNHYQQMAQPP